MGEPPASYDAGGILCADDPPACEPAVVNGDSPINVLDLIDLLVVFGQSGP